jgi:hypothetical protein
VLLSDPSGVVMEDADTALANAQQPGHRKASFVEDQRQQEMDREREAAELREETQSLAKKFAGRAVRNGEVPLTNNKPCLTSTSRLLMQTATTSLSFPSS